MPFSLQVERSDPPVIQNLDYCLIGIPPRYIYLILNDTSEGWFGRTMVRCLVNFAIGQLSNSIKIHTNHNLVCLKKSSKSGLGLSALVYCMGIS